MKPTRIHDVVPLSELPTVTMKESLYPETLVGIVGVDLEARVFERIALVTACGVLGFAAYHLLRPTHLVEVLAMDIAVLSVIALAYALRDRIGATLASAMLIASGLIHLGFVGFIYGGLVAPSLSFLAIPPWLAMFLLRTRWALGFTVATLVLVFVLFVGEAQGFLHPHHEIHPHALGLRLLYSVAAVLSGTAIGWIQERARASARTDLERATARARAMLDALPDTFVLLTPGGEIIEARVPERSALGGLSRLIHHRIHVMLDPREGERFEAALREVARTGEPTTVEVRMLLAGKLIDIEARISAHPEGDLVALLRDISLQKRSRRMKDEFVATVSHELRTPLTSVHGSLALLRNGAAGELSDQASGVVELAWRNSDRLRRIIDDLLDVQKMESGRLDLRLGWFDVGELLQQAVDGDRVYAEQYGVTLVLDPVTEAMSVRVDDDRFHQIVSNLLSNAIKYSPEGGAVTVGADARGDRVRVRVSDKGRGIPEDFKPHVFETFAQADSSETRLVGGTGLGLSICKRLVTAFGGTIGFDSVEGVGTTFWFDLPLRSSTEPAG